MWHTTKAQITKMEKKYYKLEFTVEFMFHLRKIYSIEKHKGMDWMVGFYLLFSYWDFKKLMLV